MHIHLTVINRKLFFLRNSRHQKDYQSVLKENLLKKKTRSMRRRRKEKEKKGWRRNSRLKKIENYIDKTEIILKV